MFLGLWISGTVILGRHFSKQLDQTQQQRAAGLVALLKREISKEQQDLRRAARLISVKGAVIQGTFSQECNVLLKVILPLNSVLGTDWVTIVDQNDKTLLDIRKVVLDGVEIQTNRLINLLLAGTEIATVVDTADSAPPVLVGTSRIKNEQGIIGGVLLGTVLGDDLLTQINESIGEEMMVLADDQVVASTLPNLSDDRTELSLSHTDQYIQIQKQNYFTQTIHLRGIQEQHLDLVLLISQAPLEQAKQTLWLLVMLMASLGSLIIASLGYWIAQNIARPIQSITQVAQQVVNENDFELQVSVMGEDEIGVLAQSLNQLIQWVRQYTSDLKISSQALEVKVEELTDALQQLKEAQAQLIQTEKMAGLGQMVAGVAHEINNPISFIQGNLSPLNRYFQDLLELLETYQREYPEPSEAILSQQEEIDLQFILEDLTKVLNSMRIGTERVRDIVISLRNYSRLDEAIVKQVDIHEGLNSTLLILNHRLKSGFAVLKNYGSLPPITCSPAQLNQVFTNIISNALDAMEDMEDRNSHLKQLTITTRTLSAGQVQISIQDNGPGIPPEIKTKIFDPFFTTKAVGKGTGLGLGICFKIIEQHQGEITVHSEPGQGTEFLITLPLTHETQQVYGDVIPI
jgi:signal transduction histidine kinase